MKIAELRVRALRVPMDPPHRTASGVVQESPLVLIDAVTDQGVTGHGITFTYTTAALKPVAEFVRNVAPLLKGEPLAPSEIEAKLSRRFRLLGTQGLVGMALAGIDMALWDALARSQLLSLARVLGGVPKPIQAYGAVGYDGVSESAATAEAWALRGFRGVKAKIGYPTIAEDLEVVRAIRSAVGDTVAIMVDYNQSLTPPEAIERIQRLEGEGLAWIEEPVLANDFPGHAAVARAVSTPIQCGENWWGPIELRHAVEAKASDYVMLDAMKIGGVTGWVRAASIAAVHGLPVSSHLWTELSTQLLSVSPTAHWLEYCDWWDPIMVAPMPVKNGLAMPSNAPGSGFEWDEAAIARFVA